MRTSKMTLLTCLAVVGSAFTQAKAVTLDVFGSPGIIGVNGGSGGDANAIISPNTDLTNTADATGGNAAVGFNLFVHEPGGAANAFSTTTGSFDNGTVTANSRATGGSGFFSGPGGSAAANSTATNSGNGGIANANADARGGAGGSVDVIGPSGGNGGNANAAAEAKGDGANAVATSTGGGIGLGAGFSGSGGAAISTANASGISGSAAAIANGSTSGGLFSGGGPGGAATATANSDFVAGGPATAIATAGKGGDASGFHVQSGSGAAGGAAVAAATAANGGAASAQAFGGGGGQGVTASSGLFGKGGTGGDATATAASISTQGVPADATANAVGGFGGFALSFGLSPGGDGGTANAIATASAKNSGTANATAVASGGIGGGSGGGVQCPCPLGNAGPANATSSATTINGNSAQALSVASGSSGQAQATAQTNLSVSSLQASAMSQLSGAGPVTAVAQVGQLLPSSISSGQSFSVISSLSVGLTTLASGSMGAGGIGTSALTYSESASFTFDAFGPPFLLHLLGSHSLGNGFDTATFQILDNGGTVLSESFDNLTSAQAYFSNDLVNLHLGAGPHDLQLAFLETMSGAEGFGFDYSVNFASDGPFTAAPEPSTWAMLLIGFAGIGVASYRRKHAQASHAPATS
jgi:hypothetical protein